MVVGPTANNVTGPVAKSAPGARLRSPLTPALRTETDPIVGTSTHTFTSMAFATGDGLANRMLDATTWSPVTYSVLVNVTSQTGGRLRSGTGGPMATSEGESPTGILATMVLVAVSMTSMLELRVTYTRVPSGWTATLR